VKYTDNPVQGSEEDRFEFGRYCDALSQVITKSETPLTIGVFGPWGSGKTSLLMLIKERLQDQRGEDHWQALPVWFNAWQYDRQEPIWRALIIMILDALRQEFENSVKSNPNDEATEKANEALEDLGRIEDSLYHSVEWEKLGKWTIDWAQAIESTVRGATRLALEFIPGASGLGSLLETTWSELRGETTTSEQIEKAAKAIRQESQKYRREQIQSLEQFQRQFAQLVHKMVCERNKRLIIFIDDLDRCLPEKAIEIFEAIKLFLNTEGCVFLLATDRDVIEKGIRVKYQSFIVHSQDKLDEEDIARRIPISGRDYIEKIIQLPFSIPPIQPEVVTRYIETECPPAFQSAAQAISVGLEANPRKIKRTLNLLNLLYGLSDETMDPILLAKIVIIQGRYAELYAQLFDYPGLLLDLEDFFRQKGEYSGTTSDELQEQTLHELRDKFIQHKALREMLLTEPFFSKDDRESAWQQIRSLLYLTRTTSDNQRVVQIQTSEIPLWEQLKSGDLTRIQNGLEQISAEERQKLAAQISALLAQMNLPPRERLSLGLAKGLSETSLEYLESWVLIPGRKAKIGKFPVTNHQFSKFIQDQGYQTEEFWDAQKRGWLPNGNNPAPAFWLDDRWNQPTQPVVGINWYEAQAYCRWLNHQEQGKIYRLPTFEEWMLAAGDKPQPPEDSNLIYPWGNEFDISYANTIDSNLGVTTPVDCYPLGAKNGIYDLIGNIREWLQIGKFQPGHITLKGGSWRDRADQATISAHWDVLPTLRDNYVGFRLLCEEE